MTLIHESINKKIDLFDRRLKDIFNEFEQIETRIQVLEDRLNIGLGAPQSGTNNNFVIGDSIGKYPSQY